MSNVFLAIPATAGNGPGAPVDVSALGATKTIVVHGNGSGSEPYVQIEISCTDTGDDWTAIYRFLQPGSYTITEACMRLRATVQNYDGGGAPVINVGGEDAGTTFVSLQVPANNGIGAAVDVSALPGYKTIQINGAFTGTCIVQVSNDDGTTWVQANGFAFNKGGISSGVLIGQQFRLARTGIRLGRAPGTPTVHIAATDLGGGGGVKLQERDPLSLVISTTDVPATMPCFQPTSMQTLVDDFSNTSLARFTTYSENAHPVVPVIAGNTITFAGTSGGTDWNTILVENSGLANNGLQAPQFAVSMAIASAASTAGNAYENVGVGIAKDANSFILALWQRRQGAGQLSIQVKIAGVGNIRAAVAFTTAAPFQLGLSLVSNTLTLWTTTDMTQTCNWTKRTTWALTEIDMRADVLTNGAQWRPCMSVASAPTQTFTVAMSSLKFGSYGTVGIRDIVAVTDEDGVVIEKSPGVFSATATFMDPQGAAYTACIDYDLIAHTMTMTGVIFVNRGAKLYNDAAACLVDDGAGGYYAWISTWGNADLGDASTINILQKHITSGDPLVGVNAIPTWTQPALPNIPGGGGSYDPCAAKREDGTWLLAYTVGPAAPVAYYPALASSADLTAYTGIRAATADVPYEGTRLVKLAGALWPLAGSLVNINVYNEAMANLGSIKLPIQTETGTIYPPHPTMVPIGKYVYIVTFDNTKIGSVEGTQGQLRVFRGDRYIPYVS